MKLVKERYNRDTLEVRFKGKSISDVLEMTVANAVEFFQKQPKISKKLKALDDVGLGISLRSTVNNVIWR